MTIADGVKAYKALFEAVTKRIGHEMTVTITAMDENSVDASDPLPTIREFLVPVTAMFGDVTVKRMMQDALRQAFTEQFALELVEELMGKEKKD